MTTPATLAWLGETDGHLRLIDQTLLPGELVEIDCQTVEGVWQAIKRLSVRGAPAIGVAAAYGVCLAAKAGDRTAILDACDYLATSRPTAVNLFWALDRMRAVVGETDDASASNEAGELAERLLAEARRIHQQDAQMCAAIGRHGADYFEQLFGEAIAGVNLLTHCNAGALATGGEGTALAVIFELARRGHRPHVWIDETRPLLQGARLTTWELMQREIACTLITDSMAAKVMQEGRVQAVITGADRIAANGDAANKIGTYGVATLAAAHDIPFTIAAPTSTVDPELATGAEIPIEERGAEEVSRPFGTPNAPQGVRVYNPAFDVTPARLIAAWFTQERAMTEFTVAQS